MPILLRVELERAGVALRNVGLCYDDPDVPQRGVELAERRTEVAVRIA